MLTRTQIKQQIADHAGEIRQYGVSRIGLFGSYAQDCQHAQSDIDLLLDFQQDRETFDNFMEACFLLDRIFEGYTVDVATRGGLSPYIGPHILQRAEYVQITH